MKIKKFVSATGRPMLYVPGDQLEYCDRHKYPVLIIWKRARYADVTWLNEPFQRSHGDLWRREDFRQDIEDRAEAIFQRYAIWDKSARAITASIMTLYDLTITNAEKAACDLFDMTLKIVKEYETTYPQRKTKLPMSVGSEGYMGRSGDQSGHTGEEQKKPMPE